MVLGSLAYSALGVPTPDPAVLLASPGPTVKASPGPTSKLSFPIINVGLPKSAGGSLLDFFSCGHQKVSQYHCDNDCSGDREKFGYCNDDEKSRYCGSCVAHNIKYDTAPLEGCGNYVSMTWALELWIAFVEPVAGSKCEAAPHQDCRLRFVIPLPPGRLGAGRRTVE